MESQPAATFRFNSITNVVELAAAAKALVGPNVKLHVLEFALGGADGSPSETLLMSLRRQILAGADPLGEAFTQLRSATERRADGATYTPRPIVDSMVAWAAGEGAPAWAAGEGAPAWAAGEGAPARVVDPGCGSGRFILAAAHQFPQAELVAIDLDPLATLMLRANAHVHGIDKRLTVLLEDYRSIALPPMDGRTLFIGNPPYVRHHNITPEWKEWFGRAAAARGLLVSKLAGLHVHFFLRTAELGRAGDYGCFITSAEWLDVNYGAGLRRLLADGLGGVSLHMLAPTTLPFEGTHTTGAITCFRIGNRPDTLIVRRTHSLEELRDLRAGRTVPWHEAQQATRWSRLLMPERPRPPGHIELGELFRVHRGQVTGANRVWIQDAYPGALPDAYLYPTVTRARELIAAGPALTEADPLRRVLDLPTDLDTLDAHERALIERFLAWAKAEGAGTGYIARHRRAWWAVGLRAPAPVLATYMARRAPAFVLNRCGARHINIAHGLYPREPLTEAQLENVAAWLCQHVTIDQGRTYAGGLTKFEPKELERIPMPPLEELQELHDRAKSLDPRGTRGRHRVGQDLLP